MPTPYFKNLVIGDQTYSFEHLEPFTFQLVSKLAQKTLLIHVTFTNHCFTHKYKPEKYQAGQLLLDTDTPRPRVFCPTRYRLSRELNLADLIRGMTHPKCKVSQSKERRNWAYTMQIDNPEGPYYLFFEIRKAVQAGRQRQDLSIIVESAYPDDPEEKTPVFVGDMSFILLCGKTYKRQPVTAGR